MDKDELKLYAVTDSSWLNGGRLEDAVEEVIKGGVTLLQLREKHLDDEAFYQEGVRIKRICDAHGVTLLINDNVEVARRLGVGAHIGQGDMPLSEARRLLGENVIIGVSCQRVAQAVQAEAEGADYLGVGAVFPTSTKLDADYVDGRELSAICGAVSIPVVAIGGISAGNVHHLAGSGIAGVAVVSALFAAENLQVAAEDMLSRVNEMLSVPVPTTAGAIIDLDGTILDSLPYWENLGYDYLRGKGIEAPGNLADILRSMELRDGADYLRRQYNLQVDAETIKKELISQIFHIYSDKAELFPGAYQWLKSMRENGTRMALFTSTAREAALASLRKNGIESLFDCIISNVDTGLDKSRGEAYFYVLGRLGTRLNETTIYEDAPYAIGGARQTGMRVITPDWRRK